MIVSSKMVYYGVATFAISLLGWQVAKLHAYESAEYTVIEKEENYEVREYPDLMMATTPMQRKPTGNDGSFMRLFRYISGDNDNRQKVAMTTPVFMEAKTDKDAGQMGFVLPKEVVAKRAPEPANEKVQLNKRLGGQFAVIRFKGRMNNESVARAEASLRAWMKDRRLAGEKRFESAGYDPPWTPGRLRRNEVLIRLKSSSTAAAPQTDAAVISE